MATPDRDAGGAETGAETGAERRFYAGGRAIGRFGMRAFAPYCLPAPHWHGHVEANLLTGGRMTYVFEDAEVTAPPGRLVLFWAGIPHQPVRLDPDAEAPMRLVNLYLPLDRFLFMPHVAPLQVAFLSGGVVALDPALCGEADMARWFRDYRSRDGERREVLLMELNAVLRRALLGPLDWLRAPGADLGGARRPQAPQMAHVVAMVRFIMENLAAPMSNADVARVTGLNETYALSLFTSVMRVPMRRFVIRMRLLRARALLTEGGATVASVAEAAGFASVSQFYDHFRAAYGTTPQAMRGARR